jgi:hypothetical protein
MRRADARFALAALVVLQWVCVAVFAASVRHNGWLWYQGGDETFYSTSAWLLNDGEVARTGISYLWPYVLAPVALPFGASVLELLPAIVLLNVLVLLPVALLCVYGLAARIAGRAVGLSAAALWVLLPYLAIPLFVERYHERYTEQVMPQFLGLTAMADFPSLVAVLCAAYCCFRALDERDARWAALGGLAAGLAVGLKPANALFLAAPGLVFLAWPWARRLALPFGAALLPGLCALALWKLRSLGSLPLAGAHDAGLAVIAALGPLDRYGGIDLDRLDANLDSLREFFWTVRLLEWAAVAGVVAVARRSGPKAAFLTAWLAAFVLVKGGADQASVDTGSFFRLLMPAFPAFFLLAVSLPLLVPGVAARLAPVARGAFSSRWRRLGIAVGAIALLQLVTIPLLREVPPGKAVEDEVSRVLMPVEPKLTPTATTEGSDVRLSWPDAGSGPSAVFYRVLRAESVAFREGDPNAPAAVDGVRCDTAVRGPAGCALAMTVIGISRAREWVDRAPAGEWVYRIGVAANWRDDELLGDVLLLSPPVRVTVP